MLFLRFCGNYKHIFKIALQSVYIVFFCEVLKNILVGIVENCIREYMNQVIEQSWIKSENINTPRGRFELPRREAPVAFEATAFPG